MSPCIGFFAGIAAACLIDAVWFDELLVDAATAAVEAAYSQGASACVRQWTEAP